MYTIQEVRRLFNLPIDACAGNWNKMTSLLDEQKLLQFCGKAANKKRSVIVTEKIDGGNFSVVLKIVNNCLAGIDMYNRNRILNSDDEWFEGCFQAIIDIKDQIIQLIDDIISNHSNCESIILWGEMYGNNIKKAKKKIVVQSFTQMKNLNL